MRNILSTTLVVSSLLAGLSAQSVIVADAGGGAPHTTLQSAIDAANPGDTVLLRPSTFADGAVINKPLTLISENAQTLDALEIVGLAAGEAVYLHNFSVQMVGGFGPGLRVMDCAGEVWLQYCSLGKFGIASFPRTALHIENSNSVVLRNCTVTGTGESGGTAAYLVNSSASFFNCLLYGGPGGSGSFGPPNGGHGCDLRMGSSVYLDSCTVRGGNGASVGGFSGCLGSAGNGGHGVNVAGAGVSMNHRDTTFTGGNGGISGFPCTGSNGVNGLSVTGAPTMTPLSGVAPRAWMALPGSTPTTLLVGPTMREGDSRELLIESSPGDSILLGLDLAPEVVYFPVINAPLLLGPTFTSIPLGVMPASGFFSLPITAPDLGPGGEVLTFYLQPYALTPGGELVGGHGVAATTFDTAF